MCVFAGEDPENDRLFRKNICKSLTIFGGKMTAESISTIMIDTDKRTTHVLASALKPTLLLFLLFFPLTFMQMFLHEAGHALFNLSEGVPIHFLYAHPFSFLGFVRPMADYYSIWEHASGTMLEVFVSILIFILLWKHRSFYTLPFLMIFPWIAVYDGIGGVFDILGHSGDYHNIMQITGLPAAGFYIMNLMLAVVGIFFFISLLPLLGMLPEDRKTLFVLPVGMLLYSALGLMIAYLFVPGSPIDLRYHLAPEIIQSAYYRPLFMVLIGMLLAVIYVTLYRRFYKRLPEALRTEKVNLSWRALWYPGLLFTFSVILGLMVIL